MKHISVLRIVFSCICLYFSLFGTAFAEDKSGKEIFQAMKCNKCHAPETKGRGPSLVTIANAYPDAATMYLYVNGESEAVVEPTRAKTMKPRLRKMTKLNENDKKSLSTYLMEFRDNN